METLTNGATVNGLVHVHLADTTNGPIQCQIQAVPALGDIHTFLNKCTDVSKMNSVLTVDFRASTNIISGTYTCQYITVPPGQSMTMVCIGAQLWMPYFNGGGYM